MYALASPLIVAYASLLALPPNPIFVVLEMLPEIDGALLGEVGALFVPDAANIEDVDEINIISMLGMM